MGQNAPPESGNPKSGRAQSALRTFAGVESAQVSKNPERKKYRVSRFYQQKQ